MIDEELYQLATDELNSDRRRPDLWARAVALASDDHDEARYLYTNLRVEEMLEARNTGKPQLYSDLPGQPIEAEEPDSTPEHKETEIDIFARAERAAGLDVPIDSHLRSDTSKPAIYEVASVENTNDGQDFSPTAQVSLTDDIPKSDIGVTPDPLFNDLDPELDRLAVKKPEGPLDDFADFNALDSKPSGYDSAALQDTELSFLEQPPNQPELPAELIVEHHNDTLETDQTIRLDDHNGGEIIAGQTLEFPPEQTLDYNASTLDNLTYNDPVQHSMTQEASVRGTQNQANLTLNPGEYNDGDINPRIDLDDHANQSSLASSTSAEATQYDNGGTRFYSVFTHNDGRKAAVKLGGSWPAFFLTLPWMLYKKLWGTAFIYTILLAAFLVVLVTVGLQWLDVGADAMPLIAKFFAVGFALLAAIGLFYLPYKLGNRWVSDKLERKGFDFVTALPAPNTAEAQRRVH